MRISLTVHMSGGAVGDHSPVQRRGDHDVEGGLEVGLVETREHPLRVGGFELRVQIHLAVDGIDEPVQALSGVGVGAVGVDDEDVVLSQSGQRDAGGFVVARHVDVAPVECRAANVVGGEVDVGVRAGQRVELHRRHRTEGALSWLAAAIGEVEVDAVAVDGNEGSAFDGRLTGQIGKCHPSNLSAGPPLYRFRPGTGSQSRKVPFPIEDIICGQYIEIAMPVKNAAISGGMPLFETVE